VVLASAISPLRRNTQEQQRSVVFEVFKVQDGLIRQIEAFFAATAAAFGWGPVGILIHYG